MRKKVDPRRIENLEAFAHFRKVEDAKRRHLESFSKMSDEAVASLAFALEQITEVAQENPWRSVELFRGGLSAMEHLEERGRLGWQRFCETGGQAAVVDFVEATEGEGSPSGAR